MSDYWMITCKRHRVDLLDPDPKEISLEDVARGLGQLRYSGHADWSIAQHSICVALLAAAYVRDRNLIRSEVVLPALTATQRQALEDSLDVAEADTPTHPNGGQRGLQAFLAGLLHDSHEAYIGDTPGPYSGAIGSLLTDDAKREFAAARQEIEVRLDRAIWEVACNSVCLPPLPHPLHDYPAMQHVVAMADLDMLLLERAEFFHCPVGPIEGAGAWHSAVEARAAAMAHARRTYLTEPSENHARGIRAVVDRTKNPESSALQAAWAFQTQTLCTPRHTESTEPTMQWLATLYANMGRLNRS